MQILYFFDEVPGWGPCFFLFLATLSHSLGFTALLLQNTVAPVLMYALWIVHNLLFRPKNCTKFIDFVTLAYIRDSLKIM